MADSLSVLRWMLERMLRGPQSKVRANTFCTNINDKGVDRHDCLSCHVCNTGLMSYCYSNDYAHGHAITIVLGFVCAHISTATIMQPSHRCDLLQHSRVEHAEIVHKLLLANSVGAIWSEKKKG